MTGDSGSKGKEPKDSWDKWQIILQPVGGLLTAGAVVLLTFATSKWLASWQERENNRRVYTDLMGKREEAETSLRKAMFDTIMKDFLESSSKPETSGSQNWLEDEIIKMELLAYNFHESLRLAPLFKKLERDIERRLRTDPKDQVARDCLRRLRKVAYDITEKQLAALMNPDGKNRKLFLTGTFQEPMSPGGNYVTKDLTLGGVTHLVKLGITKKDPDTQELRVSLTVRTSDPQRGADTDQLPPRSAEFWIGSFEFPMIDNTRLPNDQFCAIVLRIPEGDPDPNAVPYEVYGICFPGSRAALQEKPYYDEILDNLRK